MDADRAICGVAYAALAVSASIRVQLLFSGIEKI